MNPHRLRIILVTFLSFFFLAQHCFAQDSLRQDSIYVITANHHAHKNAYVVQEWDKVKVKVLGKSVNGRIMQITKDSLLINDDWYAVADITELKDVSFRNSKRGMLTLGVVASALVTAGSIALIASADNTTEKVLGIVGTSAGVPLLGISTYRLASAKYKWKTSNGWTFNSIPLPTEEEDEEENEQPNSHSSTH